MCHKVAFFPLVTLLNRQFRQASPVVELDVRYPVMLDANERVCPSNLGHSEIGAITVSVRNISARSYGGKHGSDKHVALRFHLGKSLNRIVDPDKYDGKHATDTRRVKWFDIAVDDIPAHGSVSTTIHVELLKSVTLYERATWRVELILRERVIEYAQHEIRCSPKFVLKADQADCLLIASRHFSRAEFECYHEMLTSLCLTYDIWDTERNGGISVNEKTGKRHQPTWYGKFYDRLIIFTLGSIDELRLFHARDLLDHLLLPGKGMDLQDRLHATVRLDEKHWKQEWRRRDKLEREARNNQAASDMWNRDYTNYESGLLIVGASSEAVRDYIMQWCSTNIRCTGSSFFGGSHITTPTEDELVKKAKELERTLFMKDRNHLYSCLSSEVRLEKTGVFSWYVSYPSHLIFVSSHYCIIISLLHCI